MRKFGYELELNDKIVADEGRIVIIDSLTEPRAGRILVEGYYEDHGDEYSRTVGENGTVVMADG